MSPLSSNTLFHFTDAADHLVNILTNEFRPHYSLEDFSMLSRKQPAPADIRMALPMVSFCDIPLSQAVGHMDTYGRFALGLTKAWGMRNGLTPVLYTHPNAVTARALVKLAQSVKVGSKSRVKEVMDVFLSVLSVSKPYEGILARHGRSSKDVRFYDEREWRFVVPLKKDIRVLWPDGYNDPQILAEMNHRAAKHVLSFTPDDIKYVIVPTEGELLPMIRELERIKGKYSLNEVKVLTSRVISAEQIIADF